MPTVVSARIGVGVGTGKIVVEDQLKPGIIYQLPLLTVLNTGDEPTTYGLSIEYHEDQPERRPSQEWFVFSPSGFSLDPGGVQQVEVTLNLPVRAAPGDYFAYLEAHPRKSSDSGTTNINIAAAAKLSFTVVPANVLSAMYYRGVSFWQVYAPWPRRAAIGILAVITVFIVRRYLNIDVSLRNRERSSPGRRSRLG